LPETLFGGASATSGDFGDGLGGGVLRFSSPIADAGEATFEDAFNLSRRCFAAWADGRFERQGPYRGHVQTKHIYRNML